MAASRSEALARRRATYQDVLDAPAHQVAEVVDGTLHPHPRPARPHARASSVLGGKIGGPFDYDAGGPGGWWIIDEPELHLGEDIVVPDLAGWRRERMPEFSGPAYFALARVHEREPLDTLARPGEHSRARHTTGPPSRIAGTRAT